MRLKAFIDYIEFEKRYSSHTVIAYSNDLNQFLKFAKDQYDVVQPDEITPVYIRSWVVYLIEQGLSNQSVNRKISCLKAYFKYLKRTSTVKTNPMVKVVAPKSGKRLPIFVEEKNMEALFTPDMFANDFEGKRDALVMELFYNTGIRLSELINLKSHDVDLAQQQIKVLGKRNKERLIPITPRMRDLIRDYLNEKKTHFSDNPEGHLIVKSDGVKLYEKLVYRIVNRYLGLVTTLKKKSPHVLRHTFATHMLNKGADLGAIKEILGHSSLAATQLYTHNTIAQLKEVHKNAHPKG